MSIDPPNVVVTSCNGRWARARVRGLLRNAALGARLAEAAGDALRVQLDTGSVRVRLTPERDNRYWVDWLSTQVRSQPHRTDVVGLSIAQRQRRTMCRSTGCSPTSVAPCR